MGAIQSAESNAKSQRAMQLLELDNRSSVADSTNRAHVISAAMPYGPSGVNSALSSYSLGSPSGYDTSVQQGREELPSKISRSNAATSRDVVETSIAPNRNPWTTIMGAISGMNDPSAQLERRLKAQASIRGVKDTIMNRGKRVPVFGRNDY